MRYCLPILLLFLLSACYDKVPYDAKIENGNVYLVYIDNTRKQVSDKGMDKLAAITPDGSKVAYIRQLAETAGDSSLCAEKNILLLYDVKTGETQTLLNPSPSAIPEETLETFNQLEFSPDGQYLYFTTCAWVTSNAIHRYNLQTGKQEYLTDGNSLKVMQTGKYKGYLIVSKHKYYPGENGGSYHHYWLLDKDGKEIKDIGDKEDVAL